MFKVPEKDRITKHAQYGTTSEDGNNGAFRMGIKYKIFALIIASDGEGWEHVSVHIMDKGKPRTPTWPEMCKIKNRFWSEEDTVLQYHPSKHDYVNMHPNTLHLWKPIGQKFPTPPKKLV